MIICLSLKFLSYKFFCSLLVYVCFIGVFCTHTESGRMVNQLKGISYQCGTLTTLLLFYRNVEKGKGSSMWMRLHIVPKVEIPKKKKKKKQDPKKIKLDLKSSEKKLRRLSYRPGLSLG